VFVPLAEEAGLVADLGRLVLRTACRDLAGWSSRGAARLAVSVNVSAHQLADPGFVDVVRDALRDNGVHGSRLVVELTETAAVEDLDQTVAVLERLRGTGVRVALDDFGTGYSSLTLLRTLPLDVVKIDRSFVVDVATGVRDAMLIRMVIDTAHTLGLRVCAEGVEEVGQAVQLAALGCDVAQGWYFGRPEPSSPALVRAIVGAARPVDRHAAPTVPMPGAEELVVVCDADLIITYASSTSTRLLGRLPARMVGSSVLDHLPAPVGHRLAAGKEVEGITRGGRVRHRALRADGSAIWFDTISTVVRADDPDAVETVFVCRDVTYLVEATKALEQSEIRFRNAFDAAPIGMAINDLDGRILQVNEAFAELLGYRVDDLVGRTVASLTHPDDAAADALNAARLQRGAEREQEVRKRYLDAAGRVVPVVVRVTVTLDQHGRAGHAIAHVVRDVEGAFAVAGHDAPV
jgi:PAS domain S-box-containing protein